MMTNQEALLTFRAGFSSLDVSLEEVMNTIQLDAFKAGAEWAANIANKTEHVMHDGGCLTTMAKCYYAIKQASSNLKEIPK